MSCKHTHTRCTRPSLDLIALSSRMQTIFIEMAIECMVLEMNNGDSKYVEKFRSSERESTGECGINYLFQELWHLKKCII